MPGDVTQLLHAIETGDPHAADELLPLVYDALRTLAAAKLAQEQPGQTLQATALVHEAWIRLDGSSQNWAGRSHFFAAAAEAMRRILIDRARRKATRKRGDGVDPREYYESLIEFGAPAEELLAVHAALDELAIKEPAAAEVVKLRYFVGMTSQQVADALGVSRRTVDRQWAYARAWLKSAIRPSG